MPSALITPRRFFREHGDELAAGPPAIVATLAFLASLASTMVTLFVGLEPLGRNSNGSFVLALVFNVPIALVEFVAIFALSLGVFYGLARLLGGDGTFEDTAKVVGWGYGPVVVQAIVNVVFLVAAQSSGVNGLRAFAGHPSIVSIVMLAITLAVYLWRCAIWIPGIRAIHDLSTWRAIATVAIPLAVVATAYAVFYAVFVFGTAL